MSNKKNILFVDLKDQFRHDGIEGVETFTNGLKGACGKFADGVEVISTQNGWRDLMDFKVGLDIVVFPNPSPIYESNGKVVKKLQNNFPCCSVLVLFDPMGSGEIREPFLRESGVSSFVIKSFSSLEPDDWFEWFDSLNPLNKDLRKGLKSNGYRYLSKGLRE